MPEWLALRIHRRLHFIDLVRVTHITKLSAQGLGYQTSLPIHNPASNAICRTVALFQIRLDLVVTNCECRCCHQAPCPLQIGGLWKLSGKSHATAMRATVRLHNLAQWHSGTRPSRIRARYARPLNLINSTILFYIHCVHLVGTECFIYLRVI